MVPAKDLLQQVTLLIFPRRGYPLQPEALQQLEALKGSWETATYVPLRFLPVNIAVKANKRQLFPLLLNISRPTICTKSFLESFKNYASVGAIAVLDRVLGEDYWDFCYSVPAVVPAHPKTHLAANRDIALPKD